MLRRYLAWHMDARAAAVFSVPALSTPSREAGSKTPKTTKRVAIQKRIRKTKLSTRKVTPEFTSESKAEERKSTTSPTGTTVSSPSFASRSLPPHPSAAAAPAPSSESGATHTSTGVSGTTKPSPQFASRGAQGESTKLRREVLQVRLQLAQALHDRQAMEVKYNALVAKLKAKPHPEKESGVTGLKDTNGTGATPRAAEAASSHHTGPIMSYETAEQLLDRMTAVDTQTQEKVVSLRYGQLALHASLEVLEMEVRRILAIGLRPGERVDDTEDSASAASEGTTSSKEAADERKRRYRLSAVDSAAIESGARQLIRQNLALRATKPAVITPLPSTAVAPTAAHASSSRDSPAMKPSPQ